MVCVYLGPLFTGFWTGLVLVRSLEPRSREEGELRSSSAEADFSAGVPHLSHHLIFLGGTLASVMLTGGSSMSDVRRESGEWGFLGVWRDY